MIFFARPKLEDFQLDTNLVTEIIKTNKTVEIISRKKHIYRIILGILLFVIWVFALGFLINFMNSMNRIIFTISIFAMFYGGVGSTYVLDYFIPYPELHNLNYKYTQYLDLLNEYPSDTEIQNLIEMDIFLQKRKTKIEYWFSLNGHDFETEVANLFEKSGFFKVTKTKGSGDGGIDIILRTKNDE